jgi:hypothetical protein
MIGFGACVVAVLFAFVIGACIGLLVAVLIRVVREEP